MTPEHIRIRHAFELFASGALKCADIWCGHSTAAERREMIRRRILEQGIADHAPDGVHSWREQYVRVYGQQLEAAK